jgi:hypothetical protein
MILLHHVFVEFFHVVQVNLSIGKKDILELKDFIRIFTLVL